MRGAKAGIRFAGGDRAAVFTAYRRRLEQYRDVFLTGPDMGTFPSDFLDDREGPLPLWARSHEGLGMDDLATGHGVKAAAEAALAHIGRTLEGAAVAVEGFGPDFLSNSGATHLYDTIDQNEEPTAALVAIEAAVREAVTAALATSEEHGITPSAAALREARDYLAQATDAPGDVLDELFAT
jgi:glutamate dehydrogenase/leucine dehydrogenase